MKVVRRWVNEVQEAVTSQHEMVQYHALSLLYQIKAHDRLAVSKLVRNKNDWFLFQNLWRFCFVCFSCTCFLVVSKLVSDTNGRFLLQKLGRFYFLSVSSFLVVSKLVRDTKLSFFVAEMLAFFLPAASIVTGFWWYLSWGETKMIGFCLQE